MAHRDGDKPDYKAGACGWRSKNAGNWAPLGERIGWVDGDAVYLEPTAAYRVAQVVARDTGEVLAVSEQVLKKRLKEKGLLASVDPNRQTISVRRTLDGCSRDVLHLSRRVVLPEEDDQSETGSQEAR